MLLLSHWFCLPRASDTQLFTGLRSILWGTTPEAATGPPGSEPCSGSPAAPPQPPPPRPPARTSERTSPSPQKRPSPPQPPPKPHLCRDICLKHGPDTMCRDPWDASLRSGPFRRQEVTRCPGGVDHIAEALPSERGCRVWLPLFELLCTEGPFLGAEAHQCARILSVLIDHLIQTLISI